MLAVREKTEQNNEKIEELCAKKRWGGRQRHSVKIRRVEKLKPTVIKKKKGEKIDSNSMSG